MSFFKFKKNKIILKEEKENIPSFFIGGFIPGTLNPGKDAYAYDHLMVPEFYIPSNEPNFNLVRMRASLQRTLHLSFPPLTLAT